MFKIRSSKYRHVFCDQPKVEECWTDFRLSTVTGDQQYIKASAKYFAVGMAGGGGPVIVNRLDRPGRFDISTSQYVSGHSGAVLDIDWNPFDDSMMATASEDTNIKLWNIPDDWEPTDDKGNARAGKSLTESLVDLTGHSKKVTLLRFHPTANNTLLSTAADHTVKVWDVENSQAVSSFDAIDNLVHDIVWDVKGDQYAFSCKDKMVRLCDGRTGMEAASFQAHQGVKSVKIVYVNDSGKMFTCGASKQSSREIKVWDLKNLDKPLHTESIDTAAGAMIPLWDADTAVMYLCGKGDGVVRLYEYEDKEPYIFKLNDGFRSNTPGKGYCAVPKRGLDVMKHETMRILKVTNSAGVQPLNFMVPRKSDAFQDDINPPTASSTPAHGCHEWLEGSSKDPVTVSLNPADRATNGHSVVVPKKAFKTVSSLAKELDDANKRIAFLEKKLQQNNIAF
ncbi:coronin like protein [Phaeodactylum tricornutum CCAP 1055/1]|jgi:coronin-1B/1C/6|uniref:Coronin n=3 Tax=Phaeodactylum tricornutum TaxID=2850 RepID=B7FY56_PHATC|nr:coronin like protein [Phaeodactylum tricornutum CCAP 1055/1]EEC48862.1 coronin like protein [Phaeodactylum tricornutum CCAP 1055/1]|eukprot:XP_002179876.1 coronin like protein [Phaeodactylum tricornutum CCAP 1055/1]